MKTPNEIKKGLEYCSMHDGCLETCVERCPYFRLDGSCVYIKSEDALAYIQQLENHIGELTEKVAQLEAAQPKWISVEERLPDDHGNYLTKIHCFIGDWIEVDTFDHTAKDWWHDTGDRTVYTTGFVTHWMPLPSMPEPPKEDA